jgi:O-antigen ligase
MFKAGNNHTVRYKARLSASNRGLVKEHYDPSWVLLFLIALIPLQNIYIGKSPSLGGGLNFLNLLVLFSFLTWKVRKDLAIPTVTQLNKPIVAYTMVLCFSVLIRSFTVGDFNIKLVQTLKDALIPLLLFFIVLNSVRDKKGIIYILVATWLPLPYMGKVFASQLSNVMSWHYSDDVRLVNGTFMMLGSNEIAAYYSSYTLLILATLYFIKDSRIKLITLCLFLINIYCLLYTHSRGAYLAFAAGVMAIFWLVNRKLLTIGIVVMLISGGFFFSFLPVSVQERLNTIVVEEGEERDNSAESRFVLWDYAIEEFKKSPLVGRGYQAFVLLNPLQKDTHNYYVKLLVEQGVIGFLVFIIILYRSAKYSLQLYKNSIDPLFKAIGIGMLGCILSLAVGNLFGDRFSHYPLISNFWIYMALVIRASIIQQEESNLLSLKST